MYEVLSVGGFTSVDPFIVDIDGFGKKVNGSLEILETFGALNSSRVSFFVHRTFTRFFVIAKRAIKHSIKRLCSGSFWRSRSFRFSSPHLTRLRGIFRYLLDFGFVFVFLFLLKAATICITRFKYFDIVPVF